jgi:hypothetical protein
MRYFSLFDYSYDECAVLTCFYSGTVRVSLGALFDDFLALLFIRPDSFHCLKLYMANKQRRMIMHLVDFNNSILWQSLRFLPPFLLKEKVEPRLRQRLRRRAKVQVYSLPDCSCRQGCVTFPYSITPMTNARF